MTDIFRYGILSDTHGFLHPNIFEVFEGVRRIYHCGDVGSPACATDLETIAPVRAIYGNMDPWNISHVWPEQIVEAAEFGVVALYHGTKYGHRNDKIIAGLLRRFAADRPRVILFGHTHTPLIREEHGVLWVNPGSASLPHRGAAPTVAILEYDPDTNGLTARLVQLAEGGGQ